MEDFTGHEGKDGNGYETIMVPHGEGNKNHERKNLLDMCNRNSWVIGNNWFQKRRSHKITHYS
jgi:hypothetical protein